MKSESAENQVRRNREAYEKIKETMEKQNYGRYALMHDGEVIEVYNDSGDAYSIGCDKYGLGHFSIQKIGEKPISLGLHGFLVPSQVSS